MRTQYLIGGLLAAALISSPALAQQSTAPSTTTPTASGDVTAKGTHWRASKLIGVNIYNDQNEKLGDIREIILDPSGKVTGYVVGVGGFLGMGEHDIMVEPSKIKFVNEPVRSASNTTTTTNPPPAGNPPAGTPSNTRNVSNTSGSTNRNDWYPDHGVLSATKDQLKAMPQFKYTNS